MMKRAMTMAAWATMVAAPAMVGAQTTTPPAEVPKICDCPAGDSRGDLRNLAAFAPLGLLGALAAAGGGPALFASRTPDAAPLQNVAANPADLPRAASEPEVSMTDRARNANPETPATGEAPSLNRRNVPEPVSPDSMRAGLRAPNTGTPLPSVLLLGTGLIAIGCVTVLRTRG
jgi:hypothetical protein